MRTANVRQPVLIEPESVFQSKVVALAKLHRWRVHYTHDSRHSPSGWPDLVMVRRDRIIFSEIKREDGKLSAAQQEWLQDLTNAGAEVFVWRPSMWSEVERVLL